ncbi:MAG: hypothetical protein ACRD82_05960, partial [Blastocatellia bacterium]
MMKIEFFRKHGACRLRNYDPQPLLLGDGVKLEDDPEESRNLDYELPREEWQPYETGGSGPTRNEWAWRPVRFVDGKDSGRTVASLRSREGYPVPVRLAEIGAVVMRDVAGRLQREFAIVERVVSFQIDLFPWDEIESLAIALRANGFRLLAADSPERGLQYDFERMRRATMNRSNYEMGQLERQAFARDDSAPTIVDGRLKSRATVFGTSGRPVVGLIKTQQQNYLHPQGWRVFHELQPGERTPAFLISGSHLDVVSWYLRLDGARGEMPNWGVVRVEVPQRFFEGRVGKDWGYV